MKENSIEEDIKSINKGLYELEDSYELHQARWAKRIFENIKGKLEHILSDYKRVIKENEDLKEKERKIYNEVQENLSFEKFLIRNNETPDDFNSGRFHVAQTIYEILKVVESEE